MYKVGIVIPHVDALYFLDCCMSQIKLYSHPEIEYEIFIIDQSKEDIYQQVVEKYDQKDNTYVIKIPRIDAGLPIDVALRYTSSDYFCSLDCDCFPIHKNWLYLPIKLIEKYNLSFVGTNSELELSYAQKGKFFHINNYFRVSKTSLAKEISEQVGFMRPQNRHNAKFKPKNNEWGDMPCDNGVVAQWYSDKKQMGDKLSLIVKSYLGYTNERGIYGMNIDDLVFHVVFGFFEDPEFILKKELGEDYFNLRREIETNGITDSLIKKWIQESTANDNPENISTKRRINNVFVQDKVDTFIDDLKEDKIQKYICDYTNPVYISSQREKIQIYTCNYNNPEFIALQMNLFNEFLKEPFNFNVIDTSSPNLQLEEIIRKECELCNANYICHPNKYTTHHQTLVQFWNEKMIYDKRVLIVDSDMFLINDLIWDDWMDNCDITGLKQWRLDKDGNELIYLFPGVLGFNMDNLPNKQYLSLDGTKAKDVYLDVGGGLYHYFENNPDVKVNLLNHTKENFEIIDNLFLHYYAGTNWPGYQKEEIKQKNIRFNNFIKQITGLDYKIKEL